MSIGSICFHFNMKFWSLMISQWWYCGLHCLRSRFQWIFINWIWWRLVIIFHSFPLVDGYPENAETSTYGSNKEEWQGTQNCFYGCSCNAGNVWFILYEMKFIPQSQYMCVYTWEKEDDKFKWGYILYQYTVTIYLLVMILLSTETQMFSWCLCTLAL